MSSPITVIVRFPDPQIRLSVAYPETQINTVIASGFGPRGAPGTNGTNGINGSNGTNGINGSNGASAIAFLTQVNMPAATNSPGNWGEFAINSQALAVYVNGTGFVYFGGFQV